MGLFDKKYCDVCGSEIKLLGNRKLEDGNLCKNCASKLSPWFSDRRRSTVLDIKKQLAYREQNQLNHNSFRVSTTLGKYWKVMVDDAAKKFCVTKDNDPAKNNADIIDNDAVTSVLCKVSEDKDEITYKDQEGKTTSYVPPRYEYEYKFELTINVRHLYFDDIKITLNQETIEDATSNLFREYLTLANQISVALTGNNVEVDTTEVTSVAIINTGAPWAQQPMNNGYNQMGMNNGYNQGYPQQPYNQGYPQQPYNQGYNQGYNQQPVGGIEGWFCPQCGTNNTGNFCNKCGTPKPAPVNAMPFCPQCGCKITDATTKFCPQCGKQLY